MRTIGGSLLVYNTQFVNCVARSDRKKDKDSVVCLVCFLKSYVLATQHSALAALSIPK